MKLLLLLVLLCLPAFSLAETCGSGSTKDSGCADCVNGTPTSDCNWCQAGFYKTGAKTCTACPDNTGRSEPMYVITETETANVCWKCAPQLKCKTCNNFPNRCTDCAPGYFIEGTVKGILLVDGCSLDCKSFPNEYFASLVPNPDTKPTKYCTDCGSMCLRCSYTSTLKRSADEPNTKQTTACESCKLGFYLKRNRDSTIAPECAVCGANCRNCKDITECYDCDPGWEKEGTDKSACTKAVPVSALASKFQLYLVGLIALCTGW